MRNDDFVRDHQAEPARCAGMPALRVADIGAIPSVDGLPFLGKRPMQSSDKRNRRVYRLRTDFAAPFCAVRQKMRPCAQQADE